MSQNPRRYLTSDKEQIYRKYKEDNGTDFVKTKDSRYRISDDLYDKLFSNMLELPEGHKISGKSTLYDAEGNKIIQWVKTQEDRDRRDELFKAAIEGLNSTIDKAKPTLTLNTNLDTDIINQYTITDYHLGMLSWKEESGDDWDLDIAEKVIIEWFKQAIELSPKSEASIFAQIGDVTHADGFEALTPASKHLLDVDTRFPKIVRSCLRIYKEVVSMLLKKHKTVHIINASGNHDPLTALWLKEVLSMYYENEPRVTVETSPDLYYSYEFGSTALFYHHGHKKNVNNVDSVLVSKFKQLYGKSKNHYAHIGHLHHLKMNETNLMIIEQHRTLAAKDSYASGGGWMSGRDSKVITYHKDFGEVARQTISIDMIKNVIGNDL